MLHTITHEGFTATVSERGAELTSLRHEETGEEYIWEADPAIWGSSAPVLFPIIGGLKGGIYYYNGSAYALPRHGLARHASFALSFASPSEKRFLLRADSETNKSYPFAFELEVGFKLEAKRLNVAYCVKNTGDHTMIYGLGSHPAFALPLQGSSLSDYWIEFDQPETLDLYYLENDLLAEKPLEKFLDSETSLPLSESIFDRDALIFKNIRSQTLSITHRTHGTRLRVDRGNHPHLGIWAKPAAPYVCIEPWHSYVDTADHDQDLTHKPSMLRLAPGKLFRSNYTIEVIEPA